MQQAHRWTDTKKDKGEDKTPAQWIEEIDAKTDM